MTVRFGNLVHTMPKGTRHITLLYHQCVVRATRPLLLWALRERLDNLGKGQEDLSTFNSFLALTTTLIMTGIRSAEKTLHILSSEETLLETFLPFDLEFTHEATLHLLMARAMFPTAVDEQDYIQQAHTIVNEMISKGNRIAQARKTELLRLESLLEEFVTRSNRHGLQVFDLSCPDVWEPLEDGCAAIAQDSSQAATGAGALAAMNLQPNFFMQPAEQGQDHIGYSFMEDIGISSDAFLAIVNQMSNVEELAQDWTGFSTNQN